MAGFCPASKAITHIINKLYHSNSINSIEFVGIVQKIAKDALDIY